VDDRHARYTENFVSVGYLSEEARLRQMDLQTIDRMEEHIHKQEAKAAADLALYEDRIASARKQISEQRLVNIPIPPPAHETQHAHTYAHCSTYIAVNPAPPRQLLLRTAIIARKAVTAIEPSQPRPQPWPRPQPQS